MESRTYDLISETVGYVAGWLAAPVVGWATRVRDARLFHAEGQLYDALAEPAGADAELRAVSRTLAGPVLVRVSAGLWRGVELPDVLGLSLRFHGEAAPVPAQADAQDLLFVSASSLLALPLAFLTTDPHDYMANRYDALATFVIKGAGRARLRARWAPHPAATGSRAQRLERAVAKRRAVVLIELCREGETEWRAILRVRLTGRSEVDQNSLGFSPFQDGAGIRPTGFVHALRVGTYFAGQRARGAQPPATTLRRDPRELSSETRRRRTRAPA